jgi:hypothetical protein
MIACLPIVFDFITQKLKNHMKGLFDEHEKNADEILEIAEKRGIELETW